AARARLRLDFPRLAGAARRAPAVAARARPFVADRRLVRAHPGVGFAIVAAGFVVASFARPELVVPAALLGAALCVEVRAGGPPDRRGPRDRAASGTSRRLPRSPAALAPLSRSFASKCSSRRPAPTIVQGGS